MSAQIPESPLRERIRTLCAARGLSHLALSRRANLGRNAVGDILAHPQRKVRPRTVAAIARALDVDPAYLCGETDQISGPGTLRRGEIGGGGAAGMMLRALAQVVSASDGGLIVFDAPHGAPGFGIPAGAAVVVERGVEGRSGDLVLVSGAGGQSIRYMVEPYLIGFDADGRLHHDVRSPDLVPLGRVVFAYFAASSA